MRGSYLCAAISAVACLTLAFVSPASADATVPTEDIAGATDNPLVKRYDGAFIVSYENAAYTDFRIPLSPLVRTDNPDDRDEMNNRLYRAERSLEVEGALTRLVYVLPENRSPLEVLRNYQDVVAEAGGETMFECKREECGGDAGKAASGGGGQMSLTQYFFHESDIKDAAFSNGACAVTSNISDQRYFAGRIPQEDREAWVTVQTYAMSDTLYCKELNGRTIAIVHVLEPKAREKKMVVVEAAEMESAIDIDGSIALYGIHFDTDKADVRPDSAPTLKEIGALMAANADLVVLVVGHTDAQGSFDYNLDLSSRRAAAVKAALVAGHGVDANRLATAGAGMMAPVATNATDEGRAKNRRVVLVKAN